MKARGIASATVRTVTDEHVGPLTPSPRRDRPIGIRGLVVDELERVDLGKLNLELIANEENQYRAQCGKN